MSDLHSFNVMNSISLQWTRAKSNAWLAFASFLVWPFLSLVYAIINWRSPWAKNIVWLFCGFFGFTFVISNEGVDANRYREYLFELHTSNIGFFDYFQMVHSGEIGRGDYLEPMLRYAVSLLTNDYRILFALFGLVFGYFYSRNIWILMEQCGERIKHQAYSFIILFIFLVPFWQINGFRFWTATHIFLYAVFHLYHYRDFKKGILLLVLSILTHTAFMLPVSLLAIFYYLPKRSSIFLALFIGSLLFVRIELAFFVNLIPENLEVPQIDLIRGYLLDEYVELRSKNYENLIWYVKYKSLPIYIYSILVSILLLTFRKNLLTNDFVKNLLYFGVFIFGVTNVIKVIPSAGRFYTLSYLCIFGALFLIVQRTKASRNIQIVYWSSILFFMIPLLLEIRMGLGFSGPGIIAFNFLYAWYFENTHAFMP